jgi:hypothetical protein
MRAHKEYNSKTAGGKNGMIKSEVSRSTRYAFDQILRRVAFVLPLLLSHFAFAEDSEPKVEVVDEMTEPLFSIPTISIKSASPLTKTERRALQNGSIDSINGFWTRKSLYALDAAIEQHFSAEVSLSMPSGSVVNVPPIVLNFSKRDGIISINGLLFRHSEKNERVSPPKTYVTQLRPGTYLIVRPIRGTVEGVLGTFACVQLDYRKLEGAERLPIEELQVPLNADRAQFSLKSFAMASHTSGVKPSVIQLSLRDILGVPPSTIERDQGVGRNPSARLVYKPKGPSEPQTLQSDEGARASSSYSVLVHNWTGEEFLKTITDTLTIRRIKVDEGVGKVIKMATRQRWLIPSVECLFVKWDTKEESSSRINKGNELQELIRKAGG